MGRPQSDVDAILACVLAIAGAFASFALLQILAAAVQGSAIGPLVPAATLGRLWVFFVLAPALLALVGVGFPCLLRALIAIARGALARDGVLSLVAVAVGTVGVVAEAAMRRSGAASLVVLCSLCLWRLRPRLIAIGDVAAAGLLACTSACLVGFGVYQQRLLTGAAASVAVAPTLFLLAFQATVVGVVMGAVGRHGTRSAASVGWLAVYAGWIGGAHAWGASSTYVAGFVLGILAVWLRASSGSRIDEGGRFL
jgi:hypothetical protein